MLALLCSLRVIVCVHLLLSNIPTPRQVFLFPVAMNTYPSCVPQASASSVRHLTQYDDVPLPVLFSFKCFSILSSQCFSCSTSCDQHTHTVSFVFPEAMNTRHSFVSQASVSSVRQVSQYGFFSHCWSCILSGVKALCGVNLLLPGALGCLEVVCFGLFDQKVVFFASSSEIIAFVGTRQLLQIGNTHEYTVRRQICCLSRASGVVVVVFLSPPVVFRFVRSWLFCCSGFWLRLFVASFWLADIG